MLLNQLPRYEILSGEALDAIDRTWQRLVRDIGVDFEDELACEIFARAGQRVDGHRVYLDPDYVLDRVARAPESFEMQARNADRNVRIGGDNMVVASFGGPPFVRGGESRTDPSFADASDFVRLCQAFPEIDVVGRVLEPIDLPVETRHLDMTSMLISLCDKPYIGMGGWRTRSEDAIAMAAIVFGGMDRIRETPAILEAVNPNSPLRFDDRMIGTLLAFAEARQPVLISPWILLGASSPVTTAAAIAQGAAESLAGIALVQEVSPGCPVVYGTYISNTDLRSGAPALGTPEGMIATLAAGQFGRRFHLPLRIGGDGHTGSQLPDAQAGYEALMAMMPTFLAGGNLVVDTVGWLESGLVSSLEKFVIDIELLRMLEWTFRPLQVDDSTLAFEAFEEVGPGGHFLGCEHTLERFRTCFYEPLLSSRDNFDRWTRKGRPDAASTARDIASTALEQFEPPHLNDSVREELETYCERRRREIIASDELVY